ncbi:MAG TPA: MXAN_5187 C-terminal domain-containing protein, partial [Polyangia bacterium]|nr:MXAN_5187 C-terminal domain-containing protein [Polyangia bacterium]
PPPPPSAAGSVFGAPASSGLGLKSMSGGLGAPAKAPPAIKPAAWAPPPQTVSAPASLPAAALGGDDDESENSESTRIVPYDENEEESAHFAHVYDEFVQAKKQCGESQAGLTFDKFMQKLRDNKAALVSKHGCRTVRFSVYVKDGKAALKATPVRD